MYWWCGEKIVLTAYFHLNVYGWLFKLQISLTTWYSWSITGDWLDDELADEKEGRILLLALYTISDPLSLSFSKWLLLFDNANLPSLYYSVKADCYWWTCECYCSTSELWLAVLALTCWLSRSSWDYWCYYLDDLIFFYCCLLLCSLFYTSLFLLSSLSSCTLTIYTCTWSFFPRLLPLVFFFCRFIWLITFLHSYISSISAP